MFVTIIVIFIVLCLISMALYRPEIDKVDNGTIILWYTPLNERNMREYTILKNGEDVH